MGGNSDCSCFRITDKNLNEVEKKLHKDGFRKTPQILEENQVFGLAKKIDNIWQIHVRVFVDGHVKAEIEPRWFYVEHIMTQSYSAHSQIEKLLSKYNMNFIQSTPIPKSCLNPKTQIPEKLTDVRSFDVNSISPLIKDSGIKVQSLQDLKDLMRGFLKIINSMATVDLYRFINLRMCKGKLRLRINCPFRGTDESFCQRDCIPTISCLIRIINRKINLNHFVVPEKNICNFEFFEKV